MQSEVRVLTQPRTVRQYHYFYRNTVYRIFRLGEIQGNHKGLPRRKMYLTQKGNAISNKGKSQMNKLTSIEHLRDMGIFSDLDVHFTKLMFSLSDSMDEESLLGIVLASHFTTQGSSCVDLSVLANQSFPLQNDSDIEAIACPILSQWHSSLRKCCVVGSPPNYTPLILNGDRLYLYRYFEYEQQLAAQIRNRCRQQCREVNSDILEEGLSRLFPFQQEISTDQQKIAARNAVLRHVCIISGGPGSGKTSTVIKILALLLEQNPNLNIALAAPTGKAAVRLQEAITQTLPHLNCASSIKEAIPQEAYTIHRLLGSRANSPYFRSHAGNILPYDVVIVDEASMVDLALMTKLAMALSQSARWILLGDKDQLASVESGTVLGDICEAGMGENINNHSHPPNSHSPIKLLDNEVPHSQSLTDSIVLLDKSYRFGENSGIWKLAQAVRQGESEKALRILNSESYPDVNWHNDGLSEGLPSTLISEIVVSFSRCLEENLPDRILQLFEQYRVLCATRRGPYGVEAINRRIREELMKKGLIRPQSRWYHGHPIMITRNDYTLNLFNGDIGIILRNPASHNELQAFFSSREGEIRSFLPNRLPAHETVYAMTIHKSQGSEFDNVLILLPHQFSPLLTRELVYTGITRAKQRVSIWGNEPVLSMAISKKINRSSGLREQLTK